MQKAYTNTNSTQQFTYNTKSQHTFNDVSKNIHSYGGADPPKITTTSNYDIYLTGAYGLLNGGEICGANDVYCCAVEPCQSTTITNIYHNVYLYGFRSGRYVTIENIGGSVYCDGYQSCYDGSMSNINGDVYASGFQSLYSTVQ